jgi:UDP-glucose 4-epimerase
MNKTLILGGAGFIGLNLAEEFVKNNEEIIIFDRKEADFSSLVRMENEIKIVKGEIKDIELIENIFKKHKIGNVIHLVSSLLPASTEEDFYREISAIIKPTFKIIDLIAKYKIDNFTFFSSGGTVYGEEKEENCESDELKPITYYGFSKVMIENYIKLINRTKELNYLIIRPSNPYGKYQDLNGKQGFISVALGKALKDQKIEIWGDGQIIRDYIYISDLCKVVYKLLDNNKKNKVYNIGSGNGTSLIKVLKILEDKLDKKIEVVFKEKREVDVKKAILNIDKISNDVDFNPMGLAKGIETFLKDISCGEIK